jgi:hypothetical protein
MKRLHRVRNFKPYLMRYVHNSDPNYEPMLRELLDHEHEVYDETTLSRKEMARGERGDNTWEVVFSELMDILTPVQIQQLFERLEKDFSTTCARFRGMAEAQKLLEHDEGGG